MAFGKRLVYQDAYSVGTNNNRYFAEDFNELVMAMQGNYVVSGCGASVGGQTDLSSAGTHVVIASGTAFVNGAERAIGSTNVDLSTAFNALSAGEARLILIYINSSGSVTTKSGDIVTDGNQLPEVSSSGWTDDNTTPLAWVYLTESDSTMSANQIFDQRVFAPDGAYINGLLVMGGNIDLDGNSLVTTNDTITNAELEFLHDISILSKTDGNFIVTNGTTFVAESGNTARTSLGLGTGNSPTFTELTIDNQGGGGNASFTANTGSTAMGVDSTFYGTPTQDLGFSGIRWGTAYITTLDESSALRFKNIEKPVINALDLIKKMQGYYYHRKDDEDKKTHVGFIAEEMNDYLPEVVTRDEEGEITGIKYTQIIPVLVEAVKETLIEIDKLNKIVNN